MPLIYRKTVKGSSEIETRAHKLAPRLRSALIMVDGKRSDQELRGLIGQQPIETIAWLLENAFIDVVTHDTLTRVTTPMQPLFNAALAPPPAPGSNSVPPGLNPQLEARRREGLRLLIEQLGPAAETLAVRIEKARTLDELRVALSAGAQTLNSVRGRDAALAFAARFSDL